MAQSSHSWGGQRTGQSCRGWRKRHSTAASGTSWERCTPRRRRHRRCHLEDCKRLFGTRTKSGGRRTDSSRLNHVADGESLDSLILGGASRAVAASDGLDVAAALLVSAAGKLVSTGVQGAQVPEPFNRRRISSRRGDRSSATVCEAIGGGLAGGGWGVVLVLSLLDHLDGCCWG
jgi:hypothetical protein